jgi:pimeloyl-ACP methyl ester carboxylesterase
MLLGAALGERLRAMILIAPAADMTETLVRPSLSATQLAELESKGVLYQPSEYGTPLPFTLKLMNDGAKHLVLGRKIPISCPVHILHGMLDAAVPWTLSLRIAEALESTQVRLTFVKDGDHRLSRSQDLALLSATLAGL